MTSPILPGAEPWSCSNDSAVGVLCLHGFTGNPSSVRRLAVAAAGVGYHVELPLLPGHGTHVDDMVPTAWDDWTGEVNRTYELLADRVDHVVLAGLSMGGTLALWCGLEHPAIAGLVCINPVATGRSDDELAMIDEFIAEGMTVLPGGGSDIANPDVIEIAYEGTPLMALRSLMRDGVDSINDRYPELTMPLRLFTSRHDHVVPPSESEFLAAAYGGDVEHTWLERSYHVATQDYDRDTIEQEMLVFVERVTSS